MKESIKSRKSGSKPESTALTSESSKLDPLCEISDQGNTCSAVGYSAAYAMKHLRNIQKQERPRIEVRMFPYKFMKPIDALDVRMCIDRVKYRLGMDWFDCTILDLLQAGF